ncbi:unnamed protein product [Gongylonema pulchrum]|uniref:Rab-GAP TBC domain-containing protein n=1 Tax=Gongylonema pulchrum TaxID=637853 RepID=A0A183EAV3_9BILA|nr:unnamed protein product [Gongylonema pulchrum]
MTVYFIAYDQYFEQELPKLHHHFDVLDVRPDLYLIEWLYTLYAKSLPFDVSCRIWDVFLRDGEQFLFTTALGILHLYEEELQAMDDFDEIVNFLTHLPQSVDINRLFDSIELLTKCCSSSCVENGKHRSFQQAYDSLSFSGHYQVIVEFSCCYADDILLFQTTMCYRSSQINRTWEFFGAFITVHQCARFSSKFTARRRAFFRGSTSHKRV